MINTSSPSNNDEGSSNLSTSQTKTAHGTVQNNNVITEQIYAYISFNKVNELKSLLEKQDNVVDLL